MELILWRHAEAEEGYPDMERRLTAKGERQADKMAAFLRTRLPEESRILVSPARRTQQTAQALTHNFITEPTVAPGASAKTILEAADWFDYQAKPNTVLIVGHQPTLGEVAALLMTGKPAFWGIKKGALWWFSRREQTGETILRLAITPELL